MLLRSAGSGVSHFAHGMCKVCFEDFIEATGGMSEGADPPAYNADAKPKVINFTSCIHAIVYSRTLVLRTLGIISQTLRKKLPCYMDICADTARSGSCWYSDTQIRLQKGSCDERYNAF